MIGAEAPLTRLCLGTSPIHTTPSFSYNCPVQLRHTYNHVLTHVLIQGERLSPVRHIFPRSLLSSILSPLWESVLRFVQCIPV
ncbi:unnamed protein product [Hymenolepis diminuta]|uniref:Uncharacterized protein n=1 Tax=Hymenolepis diminuta TaxID=6216 RepID=A0A564Z526_HYMDI|nr:unnamed protein product [Hymenolepis diminuta]